MSQDLVFLELTDAADLMFAGKVSSTTLTETMLERIAGEGHELNAYITVTADLAKKQAKAADDRRREGKALGRLDGIPIAVKDVFDLVGQPTTAGMPLRRNERAAQDATVIGRLQQAGAVILGKLNLTEGVYAEHLPPYGPPLNPWNRSRWPGASSSGCGVAVAAGLCFAALGTDTGGSIRLPSAANGITGLKPTWGRVSRHGTFELASTLDHVGPMARSARDAALMLQAIAGPDPNDPTAAQVPVPDYSAATDAGVSGMVIGIDENWISDRVNPATTDSVMAAARVLESRGAILRAVTFPDPDQIVQDWFDVCAVQTALAHAETFPARRAEYGPALAQLLDLGNMMTGLDYQRVLLRRAEFAGRVQSMFSGIDVLAIPALACPVPTLDRMTRVDDQMIYDLHRFTCSFTMSGNPTITLPSGWQADGMPIVTQFVAAHFREDSVLRIAGEFQRSTDHHKRHPRRL